MKKINFDIENDFVRILFDGTIRPESITRLISDIVNEKENLPGQLKILIDSRRARYEGKPTDLQQIFKKVNEHHKKFHTIKLTIIQQSPYETAISIIMKEMLRGLENVYFEVFSTEKAALAWLS
jgi:hypothetical protein